MRKFVAFAALPVAACSGGSTANNSAVAGEGDSAGVTALNDTTAIDAATGQAADMAADVNYTIDENATNATSNASSNTTKPPRKASPPVAEPDEPGTPGTATNNSAD